MQMELCSDVKDCIFGDYPTLSHLKVAYGYNAAKFWLIPQIFNLSEYCGVKNKLQGASLEETAAVIATEYSYLKISELMLFFHRFKAGRYGQFFGNVDPLIITSSLREFLKERNNEIAQEEQAQLAERHKDEMQDAITYEEWLEMKKKVFTF